MKKLEIQESRDGAIIRLNKDLLQQLGSGVGTKLNVSIKDGIGFRIIRKTGIGLYLSKIICIQIIGRIIK